MPYPTTSGHPFATSLTGSRGAQEYIDYFLEQSLGNVGNAHQAAVDMRHSDAAAWGEPALRNAGHALASANLMGEYGVPPVAVAGMVPTYQLAKWMAQNIPGLGPVLEHLTGFPLVDATPASLDQMYWGLKPVLSPLSTKYDRDYSKTRGSRR